MKERVFLAPVFLNLLLYIHIETTVWSLVEHSPQRQNADQHVDILVFRPDFVGVGFGERESGSCSELALWVLADQTQG